MYARAGSVLAGWLIAVIVLAVVCPIAIIVSIILCVVCCTRKRHRHRHTSTVVAAPAPPPEQAYETHTQTTQYEGYNHPHMSTTSIYNWSSSRLGSTYMQPQPPYSGTGEQYQQQNYAPGYPQ